MVNTVSDWLPSTYILPEVL